MIKEIVAFRSNVFSYQKISSPAQRDFAWKKQVEWAVCSCQERDPRRVLYSEGFDMDTVCGTDKYGHIIPAKKSNCGIYATLVPSEIGSYLLHDDRVLFLVEPVGTYWIHYDELSRAGGFRAAGAQIAYVVNAQSKAKRYVGSEMQYSFDPVIRPIDSDLRTLSPRAINMMKAAQFFEVDIISMEDAWEIAQIKWEEICPEAKWIFRDLEN